MTRKTAFSMGSAAAALGVAASPAGATTWVTPLEDWFATRTLSSGSYADCSVTWGTNQANRDSWMIECSEIHNSETATGNACDDVYVEVQVNSSNPPLSSIYVSIAGNTEEDQSKSGTLGSGTVNQMRWRLCSEEDTSCGSPSNANICSSWASTSFQK